MFISLRLLIRSLLPALFMVVATEAMATQHRESGPLRLWGELSSTYRLREVGDGDSRSTNWRNTGTINASSYLWRPWFALLNGSLSLSVDENDTEGQPETGDEFTDGNLRFDLFPTSRFPFNAYYNQSRNEFDSSDFTRIVDTAEYGLSQQYRTTDGRHSYQAEYDNSQQDRDDNNRFDSDRLLLSSGNRFGSHSLNSDVFFDTVDNRSNSESVATHAVTFDHEWNGMANLTLDNLLSWSESDSDLLDSSRDTETAQFSSFATWHPRESRDLRLTGSLRLSETQFLDESSNTGSMVTSESDNTNLNLNQGLIYEYSEHVQLSESVNANQVRNNGDNIFTASESVAARYTSDRSDTNWGDYGWSASTTYSSLHGDVDRESSLEYRFSHSLNNDYSSVGAYRLNGNATQSLEYEARADEADEKNVEHAYSLTWSDAAAGGRNLVRFFASDSRTPEPGEDFFQLMNLQYSGTSRFNRYSTLSGNLTLQMTRQRSDGEDSDQRVSNGRIEYRHNRIFRVDGLVFASVLELNERRTETEQFIQDRDSESEVAWENSLRYRIGRLETELELDFIRADGEYDQLFKFRLNRRFGDL